MYASHLMNCLLSTAIWGKTTLGILSGGAAQNYNSLQVFRYPAYFSVKDDKLNSWVKKFVFFGVKKNMKGYKLWDPQNKKNVLSKHVTIDETSLLKFTISQHVERMKTKDKSQRVEIDATPPSSGGSVSVEISPDLTPSGDQVASLDAEQIERNVDLVAAEGAKKIHISGLWRSVDVKIVSVNSNW